MTTRSRLPWIVYARTAGLKRRAYYAGFLQPDGKTYRRATLRYPVGHHRAGQHITNEADARTEAQRISESGIAASEADAIGAYLEAFWSTDGVYARDKRDQGEPLSACYRSGSYNTVRLHVRPALRELGEDSRAIDRVSPDTLRAVLRIVGDKGLKGRTVNTVRQTIAVPLRAYWEAHMHPERNPCTARLVPQFDDRPQERTIFTLAEARRFLAQRFEDFRTMKKYGEIDSRLFTTLQWQMAFTGMRLGECLGMQHGDLREVTVKSGRERVSEYWITVRHNWQEREGIKRPKRGSFGEVPVPAHVAEMMLALERKSPYGGPFLYWGFSEKRPLPKDLVEKSYNAACRAMGITDAERKRRGLGCHAWRHWYDSHVHIAPEVMQKLMRHSTAEMTTHYRHLTEEQRRQASAAVAGLIGVVTPGARKKAIRAAAH